jgi:hypothetical protein
MVVEKVFSLSFQLEKKHKKNLCQGLKFDKGFLGSEKRG